MLNPTLRWAHAHSARLLASRVPIVASRPTLVGRFYFLYGQFGHGWLVAGSPRVPEDRRLYVLDVPQYPLHNQPFKQRQKL